MKTYQVTRISGNPDWSQIPVAPIEEYLWSNVRSIVPSAQLAWDEEALYVRLSAIEPHILRRFNGTLDMVCEDSCLEFFFCPEAEGDRYFNFEVNPNGSIYVGFGRPGHARCRLYREDFRELLQIRPSDIADGWAVEMKIPVSFIQIYSPQFSLKAGMTLRGNFFKCGDETQEIHYMSWNPVGAERPNFHLPEYFGNLILGE